MKKILVTTDFSNASKSAIRFAIKWAQAQNLQLEFINVHYILKPTSWNDKMMEKYVKKELKEIDTKLKTFIETIYQDAGIEPGRFKTKVIEGIDADISLLDYADKKSGYDCICISTRGAGRLKKILGTNTGNLVTKAEIPVLAIPAGYRWRDFNSVMYATDLTDLDNEIKKVIDFAKPIEAKIDIVHFSWPNENLLDENQLNESFNKHFGYGMEFHYEKNDAIHSLIERLQEKITERKPSVVVMFTKQQRSFFQRLFLSSKSEELSFKTTVPLLVFNKE